MAVLSSTTCNHEIQRSYQQSVAKSKKNHKHLQTERKTRDLRVIIQVEDNIICQIAQSVIMYCLVTRCGSKVFCDPMWQQIAVLQFLHHPFQRQIAIWNATLRWQYKTLVLLCANQTEDEGAGFENRVLHNLHKYGAFFHMSNGVTMMFLMMSDKKLG